MATHSTTSLIEGYIAPGFGPVADAMVANLKKRRELGASLCVYEQGEKVIDAWCGLADREANRPWVEDTLCVMFSATKGLAAMVVLDLAQQGVVDYDAPVATYWPEFAQAGKEGITVRMLMNHQAGLHGLSEPLTLDDIASGRAAAILERQSPLWEPGAEQGYHAVTYGLYVAELVARATGGTSVGQYFKTMWPDVDAYIGVTAAAEPRLASLYPATTADKLLRIAPRFFGHFGTEGRVYRAAVRKRSATGRAFGVPTDLPPTQVARYGSVELLRMELPWGNGVGNGRALATVYGDMIGVSGRERRFSSDVVAPIYDRQSWQARDNVLRKPLGWSQGFLKEETRLFCPSPASFGHAGAGGSLGWADPDNGIAFGYVMNRMDFRVRSPRVLALCHALYGVVSGRGRATGP